MVLSFLLHQSSASAGQYHGIPKPPRYLDLKLAKYQRLEIVALGVYKHIPPFLRKFAVAVRNCHVFHKHIFVTLLFLFLMKLKHDAIVSNSI